MYVRFALASKLTVIGPSPDLAMSNRMGSVARDEIPQAHHLGGLRVLAAQGRQGVADREEFVRRHEDGDTGFVGFHTGEMAAVLDALFAPGVVDEDLLHGSGRSQLGPSMSS